MSFGGHVLDMINRLAQNKAMLNGRRERLRGLRDIYYEVNKPTQTSKRHIYKKLTEEERQVLKREIIKLERRDMLVRILALFIALVGTLATFYFIFK